MSWIDNPFRVEARDPSWRPARRLTSWEHFGELERVVWYLTVASCLSLLACIVLGIAVVQLANRPAQIVTHDSGQACYLNSEAFRLDARRIRGFLFPVLDRLLDLPLGVYDLTDIVALCDLAVIQAFSDYARSTAQEREDRGERREFQAFDARHWADPDAPGFLCIVVRGETSVTRWGQRDKGELPEAVPSRTTFYLAYLRHTVPSPDNPWGLQLASLRREDERGSAIWETANPLHLLALP